MESSHYHHDIPPDQTNLSQFLGAAPTHDPLDFSNDIDDIDGDPPPARQLEISFINPPPARQLENSMSYFIIQPPTGREVAEEYNANWSYTAGNSLSITNISPIRGTEQIEGIESNISLSQRVDDTISDYDGNNDILEADVSMPYQEIVDDISGHNMVVEYNEKFDTTYLDFALSALGTIKNGNSPYERRLLLSIATQCMTRAEASALSHMFVTKKEWANANKHAIFPGVGKANPPRPIYFRKRMKEEIVSEFIKWLHASNCLQNLSFGHKVVQYCNGVHAAIEAVKLTKSVRQITRDYCETWLMDDTRSSNETDTYSNADSTHDGFIDDDDCRCTAICPKSKLQCVRPKDHQSDTGSTNTRHCFTPRNQSSSIEKILGALTAGSIRSLVGLDDTDVEKGRQNFFNMKALVRTLAEAGMFGRIGCPTAEGLIERIGQMEEFHKVGFPRHLGDGKCHKATEQL